MKIQWGLLMLKNLDSFLRHIDPSENHERPDAADLRLATAAVLVAAALADQVFTAAEKSRILSALTARLGVSPLEAQTLVIEANAEDSQHKIEQFAARLREKLDIEERVNLLALTFSVIASDQESTADENVFAVKLRQQLGLSMEQSLRARKFAEHITLDGFKETVEASAEVVSAAQVFSNKLEHK